MGNEEEYYTINRIIDRRSNLNTDGSIEHRWLIRWHGYEPDSDTWEPKESFGELATPLREKFDIEFDEYTTKANEYAEQLKRVNPNAEVPKGNNILSREIDTILSYRNMRREDGDKFYIYLVKWIDFDMEEWISEDLLLNADNKVQEFWDKVRKKTERKRKSNNLDYNEDLDFSYDDLGHNYSRDKKSRIRPLPEFNTTSNPSKQMADIFDDLIPYSETTVNKLMLKEATRNVILTSEEFEKAVRNNEIDIIFASLRTGKVPKVNFTKLSLESAKRGHSYMSLFMLTYTLLPSSEDESGNSVLTYAAINNDKVFLSHLLKLGMNLNTNNSKQENPRNICNRYRYPQLTHFIQHVDFMESKNFNFHEVSGKTCRPKKTADE